MNGDSGRYPIRDAAVWLVCAICSACGGAGRPTAAAHSEPQKPVLKVEEVMIPMRDGVRLQTVIDLTPIEQQGPLPLTACAAYPVRCAR